MPISIGGSGATAPQLSKVAVPAEHPSKKRVVVLELFELFVIGVGAEAGDAEQEELPQPHANAASAGTLAFSMARDFVSRELEIWALSFEGVQIHCKLASVRGSSSRLTSG